MRIDYRKLARYLGGILAILASLLLVMAMYWLFRGVRYLIEYTHPHRALVASARDIRAGTPIAEPFFGSTANGGIENVQLQASIWFREGTSPPVPEWASDNPMWAWYQAAAPYAEWGEEYGMREEPHFDRDDAEERQRYQAQQKEWALVTSVLVQANFSTSIQKSHPVVLPREIV